MELNIWIALGAQTLGLGLGAIKIYTDMKIKIREHDLRLKTLEKKRRKYRWAIQRNYAIAE